MAGTWIKTELIGRMAADPEMRYLASGTAVCDFRVACDTGYGDNKGTEWVTCVAWEKLAEIANTYLAKGALVYIEGEPKTETWEDKQTGETKYRTKLRVNKLTLIGSKSDGGERAEQRGGTSKPAQRNRPQPAGSDDDIPF